VLIVAVYKVPYARVPDGGVNVATLPEQLTVPPVTGVVPGPARVKVVELSVAQFIASLKVAVSTWVTGTPMALFTGTTVTVGGRTIVVKLHT
jgi:hypothetical protein